MFLLVGALLAAPTFTAPLQLRPVAAKTSAKIETIVAADSPGGFTDTTLVAASYAVSERWAVGVRYGGLVYGNEWLLSNPSASVSYFIPLRDDLKLALTGGLAVPVGATDDAKLLGRGNAMRAYMENATYGINDWSIITGVDLAWASSGWTVQAEANAITGIAKQGAPASADPWKVNITTGVFAGYTFSVPLSLGVEVHYQRYASDHPTVVANGLLRDSVSVAAGTRYAFTLDDVVLRPGFVYTELVHAPTAPVNHLCAVELSVLFK